MLAFGQASLLVYWAHMELVYGKPFHAVQQALDVTAVLRQCVWLVAAMFVLATARQFIFGPLQKNAGRLWPVAEVPVPDAPAPDA